MTGSCSVTGRSSSGTKAIVGPPGARAGAAPALASEPANETANATRKATCLGKQPRMRNGTSEPVLEFRRMSSIDRREAFDLLMQLLLGDEHYRDSSAAYGAAQNDREDVEASLARALSLFIDRPDYGFV